MSERTPELMEELAIPIFGSKLPLLLDAVWRVLFLGDVTGKTGKCFIEEHEVESQDGES